MTRVAYLDCTGGLAGDMVVAALLDAGAPQTALHEVVGALGLPGVKVEAEPAVRHGVVTTLLRVIDDAPAPERRAGELLDLVASADVSAAVSDRALEALTRLADAEARIHGVPAADLVLHEIGGADTLVDVVGAFALLERLGVERVVCSPVPYARGTIATAHGPIPAPGPAVLALLDGVPLFGVEADAELVTPTGAAVAVTAASSFGELPFLELEAVGCGAGHHDASSRANVLRVVIGASRDPIPTTDVVVLEATIDDLVPELVPDAIEACRAAGALDVWVVPVQMKKGRPGVQVSAVARPGAERAVVQALLVHSSTLGVRATPTRRYELHRESRQVTVRGHAIGIKVGVLHDRVVNVAPEHDDCVRAASASGRAVKQIWAEALAAAHALIESDDDLAR